MSNDTSYGTCPCCGEMINYFKTVDEEQRNLHPGTVSICSNCGEICLVENDMTLSKVTEEQKYQIKTTWPDVYNRILRISNYFLSQHKKEQGSTSFSSPQAFSKN